MSKEYDLSNLRIINGTVDNDKLKIISWESVDKQLNGRRFWLFVKKYIVNWERNGCKDIFTDLIWNPDNVPTEQVCKWLVDLHKNEGAYKAELLCDLSKPRVK